MTTDNNFHIQISLLNTQSFFKVVFYFQSISGFSLNHASAQNKECMLIYGDFTEVSSAHTVQRLKNWKCEVTSLISEKWETTSTVIVSIIDSQRNRQIIRLECEEMGKKDKEQIIFSLHTTPAFWSNVVSLTIGFQYVILFNVTIHWHRRSIFSPLYLPLGGYIKVCRCI